MNRFSRLVGLRRIREEAEAMAYARLLARVEELKGRLGELDLQTAEAREEAGRQVVGSGGRLEPALIEGFFQGQGHRRQQLVTAIGQAREAMRQAQSVWHGARVQLRQAERMEEREGSRLALDARRREMKELDMMGILRSRSAQ